jgi:hypothetical protein
LRQNPLAERAKDKVLNDKWPSNVNLGFHVFLAAMCLSAIFTRGRRCQAVVGIVGAGALVAYVGLLFMRLQ